MDLCTSTSTAKHIICIRDIFCHNEHNASIFDGSRIFGIWIFVQIEQYETSPFLALY